MESRPTNNNKLTITALPAPVGGATSDPLAATTDPAGTSLDMDFNPFDPCRKNGFLVEWRVTSPAMVDALAAAQRHLSESTEGAVTHTKSCASNNFHMTLNEWVFTSSAQLSAATSVIQEFTDNRLPELIAAIVASQTVDGDAATTVTVTQDSDGSSVAGFANSTVAGGDSSLALHLDTLGDFRETTFFATLKGRGIKLLEAIYTELHARLHAVGLVSTAAPKRPLVCHLTLGRAQQRKGAPGKSSEWYATLQSDPYWRDSMCASDVGEVVFCAKRAPSEDTPPVLLKLFPQESSLDAACTSAASAPPTSSK